MHQGYQEQSSRAAPQIQYEDYTGSQFEPGHHGAAYDSMSTILEVDTEASSDVTLTSDDEPRSSPGTLRMEADERYQKRDERDSPVSGLSLGDGLLTDKFSGTLSALAQQVERLRGSSSPAVVKASARGVTSEEADSHQHDASTSTPDLSSSVVDGDESNPDRRASKDSLAARPRQVGSVESLMMITVSPTSSPRSRWPLAANRQRLVPGTELDERKVVEVSNKSTVTAIDLALMDRMARKFFVETREKATQSVEFGTDSDELGARTRAGIARAAELASGKSMVTKTRSVAVGTEKFSRERFSLLPPTKTRSTQTKPNMDNDIGMSETRRYKLNHLDLGPVIRGRAHDLPALGVQSPSPPPPPPPLDKKSSSDGSTSVSKDTLEVSQNPDRPNESADRETESPVQIRLAAGARLDDDSEPGADKTGGGDSLSSSPEGRQSGEQDKRVKTGGLASPVGKAESVASDGSETASRASRTSGDSLASRISGPSEVARNSKSYALIPSLKTELRVIIEINDSKQRHRSEITSDSQYLNGKLSKTTEVSTRKQVAATPSEVLERLQSIDREHSLLMGARDPHPASRASPAAVRSALTKASSQSMSNLSASPARPDKWREVSKSSVRNEIETNTRAGKSLRADKDGELVISSQALISHLTDDKSAVELKSRAARRDRPVAGRPIKERTLVESEAAFDEREATDVKLARGASSSALNIPALVSSNGPVQVPAQPSAAQMQASASSQSLSSLGTGATRTSPAHVGSGGKPATTVVQQPAPPTMTRRAQLEIEEESENRHQVTKNGQLVYDDRLRERRYERTCSPAADSPLSPRAPSQAGLAAPGAGILKRPSQPERAGRELLKPARASQTPPPPPLLFTDQNSTLSSEPETMDSGFAQSGVGSSSALNSQQLRRPRGQRGAGQPDASPSPILAGELEPASLEFVDEGVDELIEELDRSRLLSPRRAGAGYERKG